VTTETPPTTEAPGRPGERKRAPTPTLFGRRVPPPPSPPSLPSLPSTPSPPSPPFLTRYECVVVVFFLFADMISDLICEL